MAVWMILHAHPIPWKLKNWYLIDRETTLKFPPKKTPVPSQKGCGHGDGHTERELLKAAEMEASSKHHPPKHRSTIWPCWYLHLQHLCSHQLSPNLMWTMGVSTSSNPITREQPYGGINIQREMCHNLIYARHFNQLNQLCAVAFAATGPLANPLIPLSETLQGLLLGSQNRESAEEISSQTMWDSS